MFQIQKRIDSTVDNNQFVVIKPELFENWHHSEHLYVYIENVGHNLAQFIMRVDKNNIETKIEPGISKRFQLASALYNDFVFTPK